ncbi:uncharacterized protein LOC141705754 [Apium graveolens]|uniref:uncharacterized protein LOC141705754 n=1 Tax=Apium graveolens TaxID=4045 RepID=UPI003D7AEE64
MRRWTPRKHGLQIGRLCYAHHSSGESWFLRLLLTKVRGATSFLSLRAVNGVIHSSFHESCKEYGLLDDDKEWHEVLSQACTEIDDLLRSIGNSLKKYDQLPQPPNSYLNNGANNLIIEETSYGISTMDSEHRKLLRDCTEEQRKVYDAVLESVESGSGGLFFVYGSGGCGKTFLWRTLIYIAQLIKQTNLIIWDEAPMQHRYAFECLDRSLKDIMKAIDPACYKMPFGGITVVLGGDFRQILPVITYGDRADIVAACITRSKL